jgi:hypothetical protein
LEGSETGEVGSQEIGRARAGGAIEAGLFVTRWAASLGPSRTSYKGFLDLLEDRAQQRIREVEDELQITQERSGKVERDLRQATNEVERLTLERDFYSKKALASEGENRALTDTATKYSVHAQKLELELAEVATQYSQRAQKLERELAETATKYSLWGEKLERELARIVAPSQHPHSPPIDPIFPSGIVPRPE